MLQDIDNMKGSCIFYVKDDMFDQLEQHKISILTVTKLGIVMLAIQYDLVLSVSFMSDPCDGLRQSSPNILSIKEFPVNI
jgi:hypothetical protein